MLPRGRRVGRLGRRQLEQDRGRVERAPDQRAAVHPLVAPQEHRVAVVREVRRRLLVLAQPCVQVGRDLCGNEAAVEIAQLVAVVRQEGREVHLGGLAREKPAPGLCQPPRGQWEAGVELDGRAEVVDCAAPGVAVERPLSLHELAHNGVAQRTRWAVLGYAVLGDGSRECQRELRSRSGMTVLDGAMRRGEEVPSTGGLDHLEVYDQRITRALDRAERDVLRVQRLRGLLDRRVGRRRVTPRQYVVRRHQSQERGHAQRGDARQIEPQRAVRIAADRERQDGEIVPLLGHFSRPPR